MAGVFQNIDPPPPSPPSEVRGEDTLTRGRGGWGVNILEDARHSSVLYVCKYFVHLVIYSYQQQRELPKFEAEQPLPGSGCTICPSQHITYLPGYSPPAKLGRTPYWSSSLWPFCLCGSSHARLSGRSLRCRKSLLYLG